jgi:hypothetical protein
MGTRMGNFETRMGNFETRMGNFETRMGTLDGKADTSIGLLQQLVAKLPAGVPAQGAVPADGHVGAFQAGKVGGPCRF